MNKFIKDQINKITIPLPEFNDDTIHFIIKKQGIKQINDFNVGDIYTIKVENYIINEPQNFSLSSNWNYGTIPPEVDLQTQVLQVMGNMIKFKCKGISTGVEWEGWLPRKSITIIK